MKRFKEVNGDAGQTLAYLSKLETPCADCEGQGVCKGAEWALWRIEFGRLIEGGMAVADALLKIEDPEPKERQVTCKSCKGRGGRLTADGANLLAFLDRQLFNPDTPSGAQRISMLRDLLDNRLPATHD